MIISYFFLNLFILLVSQFLLFRIFVLKKKYLYTILIFLTLNIFQFLILKFSTMAKLDFLILNLIFLLSYLFFMTLVINESPSLYLIENDHKKFEKFDFVGKRIKAMQIGGLIDKNRKPTKKGLLVYEISKILSIIFLKEKKQ